ncbi:MAG: tetratricopeptide repeat protein [Actinomycetota bacterium]
MTEKPDDAQADLLIREVDEDLRQEQLEKLWKRHGGAIIAVAVALVLAVAGWQGWRSWEVKQRVASSQRYAEAVKLAEQGKRDDAGQQLQSLAADGTKGYRVLAQLKRAELRQQAGDTAGAAEIYGAVAADSGVDKAYRDMAAVKAAYLTLDGGDAAAIEKQVEPLAAETSAWRHSAREIIALAAAKRGDTAKAADLFRKLAEDAAAPQGLRARAAEMLAAIGQRPKG